MLPAPETRLTVGLAEMKVTRQSDAVLITYGLGSCLGISVHDPVAGVAGMLHAVLPSSSLDPDRARENPFLFVDTGVPLLFQACYRMGARKERIQVRVAGGASPQTAAGDVFQVGRKNVEALRQLARRNGISLQAEEVGGTCARTVSLTVESGEVRVLSSGWHDEF